MVHGDKDVLVTLFSTSLLGESIVAVRMLDLLAGRATGC